MSCLMEALQDKRVRLQPECKKRLQDRIDMWSYAAKVNVHPIQSASIQKLNSIFFFLVVPKHQLCSITLEWWFKISIIGVLTTHMLF